MSALESKERHYIQHSKVIVSNPLPFIHGHNSLGRKSRCNFYQEAALAIPGRTPASTEPVPPACPHNLSPVTEEGGAHFCPKTTAQPLDDWLNLRSYIMFTLGLSLVFPKET